MPPASGKMRVMEGREEEERRGREGGEEEGGGEEKEGGREEWDTHQERFSGHVHSDSDQ